MLLPVGVLSHAIFRNSYRIIVSTVAQCWFLALSAAARRAAVSSRLLAESSKLATGKAALLKPPANKHQDRAPSATEHTSEGSDLRSWRP